MKAADIMTVPVLAATPETSVRDIATQLVNRGISGLPVTERHGVVTGMVTEADLLLALQEGKAWDTLTAKEIMSTPPLTVDQETPLDEVMQLFQNYLVVRIPVTESGKLVGIIARRDCLRAVLEASFHQWA